MSLDHSFKSAADIVHQGHASDSASDKTYIIVSALNLNHGLRDEQVQGGKVLKLPVGQQDVDEVLNKITKWMRDHDALDQSDLHRNTASYGLYFHVLRKGHYYPSCTHQYALCDYVFAHNRPEDAGRFEDLMVMLDRHKLIGDMRKDLMADYGIQERENAAAFWLVYIGQCSRPDYRTSSSVLEAAPA